MPIERISTQQQYDINLRGLTDLQSKMYGVQSHVSSGKKVNSPADDPIGIARLLTLKQQQSLTHQYQTNIDDAVAALSLEEVQLTNMLEQIREAKALIVQANSGTRSAVDQSAIATQLQQILGQLVNLANTSVNERYIFSGAQSFNQAVVTNPDGTFAYNGDENQLSVQIAASFTLPSSDTAKNIFFNLPTNDATITTYSGRTNVTSATGGLVNSGTLGVVSSTNLQINGIALPAATADGVSTSDASGSAIASAAAINAKTSLHGVLASVNQNVFNFTGGTYTTDPVVAGDLTINGISITGVPASADATGLVSLINSANGGNGVPGIIAANNAGQLQLTAADGRNIQLQTTGTAATMNFTNFATTGGGGALDEVQKSTVTLYDEQPVTVTGSLAGLAASKFGIAAGVNAVAVNSGNAVLSNQAIIAARPVSASNSDKYLIKFSSSTQYNIYKTSAPSTPLTNFSKFSSGQSMANAVNIANVPATYAAGDTIVVEGVQFTLTGTPSAHDTFTVALNPVPTQNLFDSVQNALNSMQAYSNNSQRLSYNMGLALTNLSNAEAQIINVNAQIGAKLNLAETQKSSNSDFAFFSQQSISSIEDLDFAKAITDLVKYQMTYEATQLTAARLQNLSIFNYL